MWRSKDPSRMNHGRAAVPRFDQRCSAKSAPRNKQFLRFFLCGIKNTTDMFGPFLKELRLKKRLGLREFCIKHQHDPSNWSKIEREVMPPPRHNETLRKWAKQLGLKPDSD